MRSRLPFFIVLAAIILLAIIVLLGALVRWHQILAHLPEVLDTELETRLGRGVKIGTARFIYPGRIDLSNVYIAKGRSLNSGSLLFVPRAIVRFSLIDLLLGRQTTARSIRSIEIYQPALYITRSRKKIWDFADLFQRPPVGAEARFRGTVSIRGGRLTVIDYAAELPKLPAVNTLGNVNGSLDFRPISWVNVNARSIGTGGQILRLSASGRWGINPADTHISLNITDADAGYWFNYFSNIQTWTLDRGRFDAQILVTRPGGNPVRLSGTGNIRQGRITSRLLAVPLTSLSAKVAFDRSIINLNASASLAGSPVTGQGRINSFAQAMIDMRVTSGRMNLATLQRAVRALPATPGLTWTSPAKITARVYGRAQNPNVTADIAGAGGRLDGVSFKGLSAAGVYRNGVIEISRAAAASAGGRVSFQAVIGVPRFSIRASGTAQNINLGLLPLPSTLKASGAFSGSIRTSYAGGIGALTLAAESAGARISGVTFTSAAANITITGSRINVERLIARGPDAAFNAAGTAVIGGPINLRVSADDVNLRTILLPFGYTQITGLANLTGRLTGTFARPVLTGSVTAKDGTLRDIKYTLLSARITASQKEVVLQDALIVSGPSRLAATGSITIPAGAPVRLDLRLAGRNIDIGGLAQSLGVRERIRGTASLDLTVIGSLPMPAISGTAAVENAVFDGIDFNLAQITLESRGRATVITELTAQRGSTSVTGSGVIQANGEIAVNFAAYNLNLNMLDNVVYPYITLSGPAALSGRIGGTLRQPVVQAELSSSDPVVNRRPLDSLSGSIIWDGTRLTVRDASAVEGGASIRLPSMVFNPAVRYADGSVEIRNLPVGTVIAMLRNSPVLGRPEGQELLRFLQTLPSPFSGTLNANLAVSGPIASAKAQGTISAAGVSMGAATLERAQLAFNTSGDRLNITDATLAGPGINLSASMQIKAGKIDGLTANLADTTVPALVSVMRNIPGLSLIPFGRRLQDFAAGLPAPAAGLISANVTAENLQDNGTGTLSLAAAGVSLAENPVGNINAQANLLGQTITLNQFIISRDGAQATVAGSIGLNGLISLTGQGSAVPLSIANILFPRQKISGTADFTFRAGGTISNPLVETAFTARDVSASGVLLNTVSTQRLIIAGGRISTESLNIASDSGSAIIFGSAPFVWKRPFIPPDQPLMLAIKVSDPNFSLAHSLVPAIEEAGGDFAANIAVNGTINNPILQGDISLQNGRLKLSDFRNDFTNISLSATLQGSTVTIGSLTGSSTGGGSFNMGGTVLLSGPQTGMVNAFASLNSLGISAQNLVGAGESISLVATGQLSITESIKSPLVQGRLVVRDAVLSVPATSVTTTLQPAALPVNPRIAVTLDLAQNVVVERGGLRAQVQGPVTLAGTAGRPIAAGTVQIITGRLNYANRSLELLRGGTASFVLQPPSPAIITVNASAQTRITAASTISGRLTRYTVTLNFEGPIGDLNIGVRSSPPGLSDMEALTLVLGGNALEALLRGQPFEQIFQQQIGELLLGYVIPGIFQPIEFGGLTLALEPGLEIPLQISATALLADRVTLNYSRTLIGVGTLDTISLSYLITDQLAFTVLFEEVNGSPNDTQFLAEYYTRF